MAVNLTKGSKVSLEKVAADAGIQGLNNILVGLGWDVNQYSGSEFDLDVSAFLLGSNEKVRETNDFVFYNSTMKNTNNMACDTAQSVIYTGDNKTGAGDGDDEQVLIDLSKVPADVNKIVFTVSIFQAAKRNQNFGQVQNSYIHVQDQISGTDLIRYDLGEDYSSETSLIVAELYRHNGEWKFNPLGAGVSGGLQELCERYGV